MTGKEVSRWADSAMYRSEPLDASGGPRVTLLNATPDPLGSLAALCAMYEGRVVRNLAEVTDEARRQAFADMQATELSGPLEVAQFHFLVEGVTRSFTHQMVRERQAFFAQESMRFAVVEGEVWATRAARPPSLSAPTSGVVDYLEGAVSEEQARYDVLVDAWEDSINVAQQAYMQLVESGIPAEDARGLMPHAMTTRLHWVLDLRGLLHVAGLRLCTQAQFEWRQVMAQVVKALRDYPSSPPPARRYEPDAWQFELIAEALRPVCYQQSRCGFMAKFDRDCTIRERVEQNAMMGRPSVDWDKDYTVCRGGTIQYYRTDAVTEVPEQLIEHGNHFDEIEIRAIRPEEWAADPTAARRRNV